ncbi:hypothetical protein GCM10023085_47080 [Actinomadura viridis]
MRWVERADEICSIGIRRGVIRLTSVEMRTTYGGLIEGVPTASHNERVIERAAERAGKMFRRPVYVVPPVRTGGGRTGFRGEPVEFLPPVECTGSFSGPPTSRAAGDWWFTSLAVVWFQALGGRVVHPDAEKAMYGMPWDELAQDFTFDDW